MTVEVEFDDLPENGPLEEWWEGTCIGCKGPLKARYWMWMGTKTHAYVHDKCAQLYHKRLREGPSKEEVGIPERFAHWEVAKFSDKKAFWDAQGFQPDNKYKVLALLGNPGKGKSRLMWQVVKQFFEIWADQKGQSKWVEYLHFSDLMTEYDQSKITKAKLAQFVFLDDLADAPSGRSKSMIQEVVRHRCQMQKWTFLTIDSDKFDSDLLTNVFRERATVVKVE